MNQTTKSTLPRWYWLVAVVALLWNLLGCTFFAIEMFAQESMMESMSAEQKQWARSIPPWIYVVYAIAVSTGVLGTIGLLLRKSWSIPVFVISLVAVLIQMIYTMIIAGGLRVMGPAAVGMPAVVILIAISLLWFSWYAKRRDWLGSPAFGH